MDNDNKLKREYKLLNKTEECEKFNGFDIFYSEKYTIISDYVCNKTYETITETESLKPVETTDIKEEVKESTIIKEEEFICQLEKCSQCNRESSSKNLCETCNEIKGYYPLKDSSSNVDPLYKDCFNETTKPINYYFNDKEKYYMPCYEFCKTCKYKEIIQLIIVLHVLLVIFLFLD